MNTRKFHEIWIEQCDATYEIKLRYGVKAAFDYDELDEDDELIRESPAVAAERTRQFASFKELLTTAELGTS